MPQSNRAAIGIHAGVIILQTQHAQHRQALGGKGLVEFNHIHLRQRQTGERQHFLGGGCGAYAHDARGHTGGRHAHHTGAGG